MTIPQTDDDRMVDDPSTAVVIAYVHQNEVSSSWHHSMIELIGWDLAHEGRIVRGGYIATRCGTDGLVEARNKTVRTFLDEREADWLFWIDTDMGFAADTIDRLFEVADAKTRPVVGGLCFTQRETGSDGLGGWRTSAAPTIFDWVKLDNDQMGFTVQWGYPSDAVVECAGTGSACILIHKSAFERVESKFGRTWYDRVPNPTTGQIVSEDLSFCMRAGAASPRVPVWIHTGVKTTHHKQVWLSEDDYISQAAPPPATEQCAVIVPVMKRPENAKPFMETLRASTGMATVYAVADENDDKTVAAWRDAGAQMIVLTGSTEPGTFAQKVNEGFRVTREPWVFITGDDVRFHSGWLDQAIDASGVQYDVIGTNDLANPRVVAGEHGTHLLIRRSYIDAHGASWDGPGTIAHEGYRHWYVDDEIVAVAKQRGVWAAATSSVVEHMHPMVGKAPNDEVYQLGQSFAQQDRKTFQRRQVKYSQNTGR